MKVIIIDDEKHALITLEHLLQQFDEVEILACVQDCTTAKEAIETLCPDLVFLDIDMHPLSGFDVLNQLADIRFRVIFTTAYDQYAIKALKMNALDYLLKPIDLSELQTALQNYAREDMLAMKDNVAQLSGFTIRELSETLALSTQQGLFFIKTKDVMYFSASSSYTYVIMQTGEKHLVSKSLALFEEVLKDNPVFFRAHKSSLINLNCIKQYIRGDGGDIVMQDDTYITLSRNKKQEFLNLFKRI